MVVIVIFLCSGNCPPRVSNNVSVLEINLHDLTRSGYPFADDGLVAFSLSKLAICGVKPSQALRKQGPLAHTKSDRKRKVVNKRSLLSSPHAQ